MKRFIVATLLYLLAVLSYGQTMPQVRVEMKDSLYQELLTRDIFSDVRLPTDSVVYTDIAGYGTKVAFDGAIRYKGNTTRYYPKKGHQIKFSSDFPSPTQPGKFFRTLTLNPMYTDKSFVREAFVWNAYHDLGTMAPQTTYAQFTINNDYKGLYLQIDKVDKYLIKNWGRNNKCQIFEAEDYWCQGTLNIVPDSLLRIYYLPELDPTDLQYERLRDMIYALNTVDSSQFVEWFDENWDTKSVMDWFVVNILSTEGDTYNKNYFIYNDTTRSTQQWTIIPWDYDLSMGRKGDNMIAYPYSLLNDLFVYTYEPLAGPDNVLKDRFRRSPVLMERLRSYLDSLFTNVWTEERLHARIDSLAAVVAPYVHQESVPQDWGQTDAFEEQIEALKYYITVRRNFVIATFIRPLGGEYHMATVRTPLDSPGVWNHAIAIDGRQVASIRLTDWAGMIDSISFRVRPDSIPPGQFDTTRGYIERWLEVTPYGTFSTFTADIQWSWNEYNQEDSEVRGDERSLVPHYWLAESDPSGYFPIHVGQVNAYGNFVTMEGINNTMVGTNRHFAVLMPGVTSVTESRVVASYELRQNYPNPFNPSTTISYALPARSHVTLTVFNTLGQEVAQLVNGDMDAGHHEVRFDGSTLASGVYFYRIRAESYRETKKFLLVR